MDNPTAQQEKEYLWRLFILLSAILILRIILICTSGLDLAPDEAYYWDWSRNLDWGYYSKPPMVAWIIGASTRVLGNTVMGVRLPAAILSTLAIVPVYLLTKRLFNHKAGMAAVILTLANPGACLPGLIMTIDAPLLFFWSASLYTLYRAIETPDRLTWWILTGLVTGLGLLSKQTMVAFWGLTGIYILADRQSRSLLVKPGLYLAVGIFILSIVPDLVWNYHHHWITFQHTAHHFQGVEKGHGISLNTFLRFLLSQAGLISPVTYILILLVGGWTIFKFRSILYRARPLVFLGPAALFCILLLSLRQKVNANWPAPFYLAATIILGAWAYGFIPSPKAISNLKKLFWPGVWLGALMAAILYSTPYLFNYTNLGQKIPDPTYRLRGWKELGRAAELQLSKLPDKDKTFFVSDSRKEVSELAFYVPGNPRVYKWPGCRPQIRSQYEIWPGPLNKKGWNALVVLKAEDRFPEGLKKCFETTTMLGSIEIPINKKRKRHYTFYLCKRLKTWPSVQHD